MLPNSSSGGASPRPPTGNKGAPINLLEAKARLAEARSAKGKDKGSGNAAPASTVARDLTAAVRARGL